MTGMGWKAVAGIFGEAVAKTTVLKRLQPLFWLGNIVLASLAVASMSIHAIAIVSLSTVFVFFAGWLVTGFVDRQRLHAIVGDKWIEGEIGIYSSLAFWGGILIAGVAPDSGERMPLFSLIAALVVFGMVGLLLSLLPLTRLRSR